MTSIRAIELSLALLHWCKHFHLHQCSQHTLPTPRTQDGRPREVTKLLPKDHFVPSSERRRQNAWYSGLSLNDARSIWFANDRNGASPNSSKRARSARSLREVEISTVANASRKCPRN